MFIIIAAIGKNNEIGKNGGLCFHLKNDMEFFREKTINHKVAMGYNTWKSLPNKLKNRKNIVIYEHDTTGPDKIVHKIDEFINKNKDTNEEIYIIGGGMIYRQFLPYAKKLYLTEIDATDPEATVFFPVFDQSKYDKMIIKEGSEESLKYTINEYRRKK